MDCFWIKISPSVTKGICLLNQIDEIKCEHFLRRIVSKMKIKDSEIFSSDEEEKLLKIFHMDQESLQLAIKTVIFIFKRSLKYILMPVDLKHDLKKLGFSNEKADLLVKIWSAETRTMLNDLGTTSIDKTSDSLDFSWKLNAELSSDCCKKTKTPKAYLMLSSETEELDIELTHPDLYSMFLQFEAIQNELDNIGV